MVKKSGGHSVWRALSVGGHSGAWHSVGRALSREGTVLLTFLMVTQ